ncbi:hypothetical protein VFPPC_17567 [Pochonia chlamydosporia 170]|uniref:Uncharacterized protein n=1 Tax=Pochonia chlamydosporia 170 TaxID=1380566 RepID=A0A219AR78_METCM|nr:hypothetical protein VFPPC_17567 [Pochonia chlamydosporia 170]OWT43270.1 hypothetical protein VFPPC_17567 [Pochonia chlamydosporia 170]
MAPPSSESCSLEGQTWIWIWTWIWILTWTRLLRPLSFWREMGLGPFSHLGILHQTFCPQLLHTSYLPCRACLRNTFDCLNS